MSNTIISSWVKPVNKLFMQHGINRGYVSTPLARLYKFTVVCVGISRLFPDSFRPFSVTLSTLKIAQSHLLIDLFTHYPQGLLLQPLRKNLKG